MSSRADQLNQPNHLGKTMVLTATEEHRARADKALEDRENLRSQNCLVAQVFKDQFPQLPISVSYWTVEVGWEDRWELDTQGNNLVLAYDRQDEISLPHTFSVTLQEQG